MLKIKYTFLDQSATGTPDQACGGKSQTLGDRVTGVKSQWIFSESVTATDSDDKSRESGQPSGRIVWKGGIG